MPDTYSYLPSFNFALVLNGEQIAFQEISGISEEISVEEVTCGGENRFKYRLPAVCASQNLVLKGAMVPAPSSFVSWCRGFISGGLSGVLQTKDVTVCLLNEKQQVSMQWLFHNAWPVKYYFSDMKSDDNALMIESVELAYTYFEVTPPQQ
jgi:phage tail-like protein